jgi:hypothetical protein
MSIVHHGIPDGAPVLELPQQCDCACAGVARALPHGVIGALSLNLRQAYLAIHLAELAQLRGYYAIFQEVER